MSVTCSREWFPERETSANLERLRGSESISIWSIFQGRLAASSGGGGYGSKLGVHRSKMCLKIGHATFSWFVTMFILFSIKIAINWLFISFNWSTWGCIPLSKWVTPSAIYGIIMNYWLVVYLPLWKIWKPVWIIIPNMWENKKCSKPPTRLNMDYKPLK